MKTIGLAEMLPIINLLFVRGVNNFMYFKKMRELEVVRKTFD